jgi:hypothetical protein
MSAVTKSWLIEQIAFEREVVAKRLTTDARAMNTGKTQQQAQTDLMYINAELIALELKARQANDGDARDLFLRSLFPLQARLNKLDVALAEFALGGDA